MVDILLALSVVIGICLSMSVGINTLGATVGIIRGSTDLDYIKALVFVVLSALAGVALLSNRIVDTISKNLIQLNVSGMFAVLLAVAIIAAVLAARGVQISTIYVIVGAIAGYGTVAAGFTNITMLKEIIAAIFASPFIALIISFIAFYSMKNFLIKNLKSIQKIESFEMKFFFPSFIAMLILAFALGANSIGVIMGLFGDSFGFATLALIGSAGLLVGILFFGKKASQKIGIELADLSPSRGFIVMLATGIVMAAFAYFGIPVSTTQTLLGSVIGVGLAARHVDAKEAARVSAAWLIALPAAILILSAIVSGGIKLII